ncbi:MAG: hypothetical protein KDJ70_13915, partial [Candidatus Competibacteraceae bacterium]|nr:hypothetical protein [Candidatus Competibacteraceae bacterium]
LQQYRHLYNHYIPQKNLGHVTPIDKLKEYYRVKPELFQKNLLIIRDSTIAKVYLNADNAY